MDLFKKVKEADYADDFTTFPLTFEKYKWYKVILVFILAFIFFAILTNLSSVLLIASNILPLNEMIAFLKLDSISQNVEAYTTNGLFTIAIVAMIVPSLFFAIKVVHERPVSSYLSMSKWKWGVFLKTLIIGFVVFGIFNIIDIVYNGEFLNNHFTIITFLLCLLLTPIQGFAEEFMCRGVMMQGFGSWFKIPAIAIVLQALLFTVLHGYDILGQLNVFIIGLSFGIIAWYFKGLEISTAIHCVNNLFAFFTTGFGFDIGIRDPVVEFIFSIVMLLATIGLILFLDKKFNWFKLNES